jgi:uncharacterized protein with GYD domain
MPKFMVQTSYTADGLKGLKKETASGRRASIEKAIRSVGGKMESFHFCLGDYDVVTIIDLPDHVTAAALGLTGSASGLVRTKTTALLTVEETDQALGKSIDYRPPGK